MLGAIGCVERIDATNNVYRITVVWQGLMPTAAPGVTCGQNKFGDDSLRRAVSVQVRIASLS